MPKYRSKFEETTARNLNARGVEFGYESFYIPYLQPEKWRKYTPDFWVLDNGVIVESKGRLDDDDRAKMRLVKEQWPGLRIHILFQNSKVKIAKGSKTTYGMWAEKYGFPYADKIIPNEWLELPPDPYSVEQARRFIQEQHDANKVKRKSKRA